MARTKTNPLNNDAGKTQAVVAEYNYVSGLIPFYRRMELIAVVGVGATGAALIGAIATLEARRDGQMTTAAIANNEVIDRAEALLLVLAPYVFMLATSLVVTALVRIRRASVYIREVLAPFRPDIFQFETAKLNQVLNQYDKIWILRVINVVGKTSLPVLLITTLPALAVVLLAQVVPDGAPSAGLLIVGWVGAGVTLLVGAVAAFYTIYHERHADAG